MSLSHVVVRIEGGLGNQIFQYAAARSLADRLGCDLLLDLRWLAINGDRPFQLDRYNIRAQIAGDDLLRTLPNARNSRVGRLKANLSMRYPTLFDYPIFWSRTFAYDSRFAQISHPVYLVGYWQSEKYFAWNRKIILGDLTVKGALALDDALWRRIRTVESVALHVRRGDYISNPGAAAYHGVCGLDYYHAALDRLRETVADFELFVFSDDPAWVRENLQVPGTMHVVESQGADAGLIDFELMSGCRHHILANSSYSWWAAWRCQNPGQQAFAPLQWVLDSGVDTRDVVPERWHLIA